MGRLAPVMQVVAEGPMKEGTARQLFCQLLDALGCCHSQARRLGCGWMESRGGQGCEGAATARCMWGAECGVR